MLSKSDKGISISIAKTLAPAFDELYKLPVIQEMGLTQAQFCDCIIGAIWDRYNKLPERLKRRYVGQYRRNQYNPIVHNPKARILDKEVPSSNNKKGAHYAAMSGIVSQQDAIIRACVSLHTKIDPELRDFMSIFDITIEEIKEQKKLLIQDK